nr:sugar transferase [candidate division Zixibacteria bacterium]
MNFSADTAAVKSLRRESISPHRIITGDIEKAAGVKKTAAGIPFKIETLLYHGIKLLLLPIGLWLTDKISSGGGSLPVMMVLIVAAYLASGFAIPSERLTSIRVRRASIKTFVIGQVKFALILTAIVYFSGYSLSGETLGLYLSINGAIQSFLFIFWRSYNQKLTAYGRKTARARKMLVIGTGRRARAAVDLIMSDNNPDISLVGFIDFRAERLWRYHDIPLLGDTGRLTEVIIQNHIDGVILAVEPDDFGASHDVFNVVEQMGVDICIFSGLYQPRLSNCHQADLNGHPVLIYRTVNGTDLGRFLKNFGDKLGALLGLIIASPILLTAAVAIKLNSRGPIFFKQRRCGKNGRTFQMYKLRTMYNGADKQKEKLLHLNEMTGPVFKIKNDPRVTPVGRILRKFSIDEFPQFINILKGDMSLVGPRPPLPSEVKQYEPWQRRKLSVKPGATCLWQINGRNHVDFDKWMKLDLHYIDHWSLKEDFRILMKTVPAVFKGNGAS